MRIHQLGENAVATKSGRRAGEAGTRNAGCVPRGRFVLPFILSLIAMVAVPLATVAAAADTSCLTGADPSVANDAEQIAALEVVIATECPCASFDGSEGNTTRDYKKCFVSNIKAAKSAGALRAQCKGLVLKAYKASTCGHAAVPEMLPCIETANGKRRCLIKSGSECIDQPGRIDRVPCPSTTRCVDAADTSGNYQVNSGDSGACIVPPTTTSSTSTTTLPPTTTSTSTTTLETSTTTLPDSTTTTTLEEEPWTFCANELQPCNLPGNRTVRYGPVGGPYLTRNLRTTEHRSVVDCSDATFGGDPAPPEPKRCEYSVEEVCVPDFDEGPHVMVALDLATDFEEFVRFDGDRGFGEKYTCDVHSGCPVDQTVIALDYHDFSVSDMIDSRVCNGAPSLSYHWELQYPLGLGNPAIYASQGITGYRSMVYAIQQNAIPNQDESTNPDQFWRMRLRVREEPRADIPASPAKETVYVFRILYEGSAWGLTLSATCQTKFVTDSECPVTELLRATEPF